MTFDKEKFKTLVLYVIWRSSGMRDFGLTRLNKVLWLSDARAFETTGKSVTGESYRRQKFGPVADHLDEILQQFRDSRQAQLWIEPYFDFEITRYTAHAPPDMSAFSGHELGIIDWWIKTISDERPAASPAGPSHDYAWQIAKMGEELPLQAFLANRIRQPREGEELDWARAAVKLQVPA